MFHETTFLLATVRFTDITCAMRNPECLKQWPDCVDGEYNPLCCRFPKSCSCDIRDPNEIDLEAMRHAEEFMLEYESDFRALAKIERQEFLDALSEQREVISDSEVTRLWSNASEMDTVPEFPTQAHAFAYLLYQHIKYHANQSN